MSSNKESKNKKRTKISRRAFIGGAASLGASMLISKSTAHADINANDLEDRKSRGSVLRRRASRHDFPKRKIRHRSNQDLQRFDGIASFSKGLPHDNLGEPSPSQFKKFTTALDQQNFRSLDKLNTGIRPFVSPQSGVAMSLQSRDGYFFTMPPAPKFDSPELAAELVELYWQSNLRDLPFSDYSSDADAGRAVTELSQLSGFKGPPPAPETLFRGGLAGDTDGPYISQFLLQTIPMGSLQIEQRGFPGIPVEHLTNYEDWLLVQNGNFQKINPTRENSSFYIRNGRDLAWYVWNDRLYQAYFNAASILIDTDLVNFVSIESRVDSGNPYRNLRATEGLATYGPKHILGLIAEVALLAQKAVWLQKWFIHLRPRPELIGGRVHNMMTGTASYPIDSDILNSDALSESFSRYGSYLLPQMFIEGSPMHPSYGAGHATVAGACVTVLKAFFEESLIYENPVIPDSTGTSLVPYTEVLTVGGELNKLASNISIGRNFAGIHYRSDFADSLRLGEQVAIQLLRRQLAFHVERNRYNFTRFNGKAITIGP